MIAARWTLRIVCVVVFGILGIAGGLVVAFLISQFTVSIPRFDAVMPVIEMAVLIGGMWLGGAVGYHIAFRSEPDRLDKTKCMKCDYNLTGNTTGKCPECGHTIPIAQREWLERDTKDPPV